MVHEVALLFALLFAADAHAGLPPTFTKIQGDSVPIFTTSIDFSSFFQGTHTGPKLSLVNFIGNAATATQLFTTPTQCTGAQFATGIQANGNANCSTPSAGSGSPGGSTTQVQYNNAGLFGGADQMTWDSTNHRLTLGDGTAGALTPALLMSWATNGKYVVNKSGSVESFWGTDAGGTELGNFSDHDVAIRSNNTDRVHIYSGASAGRLDLNDSDIRVTANGTVKLGASNLIAFDTTNNYESIGTSTLDSPLHIGAGTNATIANPTININFNDTAQHGVALRNTNVSGFQIIDSTQYTLGTLLANPLVIRTNNSDRLTFDGTNGNATLASSSSASSGTFVGVNITPTYNQTSTASATDIQINRTETSVGSGNQKFIDMQVSGSSKAYFLHDGSLIANTLEGTSLQTVANNAALGIQTLRTYNAAGDGVTVFGTSNGITNSSGTFVGVDIKPQYNQTATAAATDLKINRAGTTGTGTQKLIDAQVAGVSEFQVFPNGTAALKVQGAGSTPTCSATFDGALALTSAYVLCVCKGGSSSWVKTSDGSTACTF